MEDELPGEAKGTDPVPQASSLLPPTGVNPGVIMTTMQKVSVVHLYNDCGHLGTPAYRQHRTFCTLGSAWQGRTYALRGLGGLGPDPLSPCPPAIFANSFVRVFFGGFRKALISPTGPSGHSERNATRHDVTFARRSVESHSLPAPNLF